MTGFVQQMTCLLQLVVVFFGCFVLNGFTNGVRHDNVYVLKTPADNTHSKMWLTTESSFFRCHFQACTDMKVALSRDPQVTDSNVYEIIVGGWTNTQSVIRRGLGGDTVATVATPDILSCSESRPFWIGWQNGNITVGRGNVTGQESFMSYADPAPYVIAAVSLASGYDGNGNGTYHLYQDEARMAIATTPPIMSYDTLWLLQSQKSYVKFGVKTCNDAILALSANMTTTTNTWEVVIGGYNNTQSDIRPGFGQPPSASASTPAVLNCSETRHFWVSYEGGFVEVGQGTELGQRRFLSWKYDNPHKVEAIGFSGWDKENEWEFIHNENDALILKTQSDNAPDSNWMNVDGKTEFQFRLKASKFAKVELRTAHENLKAEPAFKIVIGGEQKSRHLLGSGESKPREGAIGIVEIIYLNASNHQVSKIFEVEDLLNSNGYRRFWITWSNRKVEIGRNDLGTEIIGSVDDPVYDRYFHSLHLGTGDLQHHQEWEFLLNSFLATGVKSSAASGDEFKANWVTLRGGSYIVLRIRACQDARIILASYVKVATVSFYEIMIGANGNQASKIGRDGLSSGGGVIEASTPNVLHCNYTRSFWISWRGTYVQVGSGSVVGENVFLQLEDSNQYKIRAIAFDTSAPTVGLWEFGIVEGESYVVHTPANGFAGHRYFRLATHKVVFYFDVIACRDAVVTFSNGTHYVAEVVIGAANNTKSELRTLVGEPPLVAEKETRGVLHCQARRSFWVLWSYEWLRLGTGTLYENVIVELRIPMLRVETLSITTRGVPGRWSFYIQSGKYVETETPNHYAYNNTWMTLDGKKSTVFKVKACNDAHVALSRTLGMTSMHTYEVVLGAYGNTKSLIRNATQGSEWVSLDTPGILNCTAMLTFWLSWDAGLVKVGRGGVIGSNEFMHWQDPNPYSVHALGISSGWGAEASWQFSNLPGDTYLARTSSSLEYTGMNIVLDARYMLEFRVQACSSAALAMYARYHSTLLYEVGIGMNQNTILSIYNAKTGIYEKWLHYPDLLSCWQERAFWVSWKGGVIQVGKGLYPQSRIAEWVDSAPESVDSITLFTWPDTYDSEGFWEISVPQVYQLTMSSRSVGNYDVLSVTRSRPYLVLSVLACADVTVALSEVLGMTSARSYKVLLAFGVSQDQLEIHRNDERKVHRHISCVLHCSQFRQLWISWENGLVAVGHGGAVGANPYLSWQDTHPLPISSVAFSSYSETTEFQIRSDESEMYMINTPSGTNELHTWVVMQHTEAGIVFDAMSCHEVSVIIAAELGVIHQKAFEFLFGSEENTKIELRKSENAAFTKIHEAPMSGHLHCASYQSFWVMWRDGVLSAGYGIPEQFPMITWTLNPEDVFPIQGVTLGYKAPSPISWKIVKDQTLQLLVTSLKDNSHLRNWISVRMGPFLAFQVKACHNAFVILGGHMHATNGSGVYYVELGLKSDSYSYIREPATGATLAAVHTPGVLQCNYYRPFWIGWFRNSIEVGYGYDIGQNVFMRWDSGKAHRIRAAGFSTFGGERGFYRLHATQANYDLIKTRSDDADFTRVALKWSAREFFVFRVIACRGARLRLDGSGFLVEIGIDDNERSVIRSSDGAILKSIETMRILSCYYFRLFWISWANGIIDLGDAEGNVIVSWNVGTSVQVTGLSLATEVGTEGQWQTEQYAESELTVKTPDQWDRIHLWSTVIGREFVTFQVAACHDAHLALSFVPTYPEMLTYQVIIGGWTNTKSAIRDEVNQQTETKVEVETPNILDCSEKRDFWAGWRNQTIKVGTGQVPFEYTFMEWRDPYFFQVEAVGMSTGHGATGEWTLKAKNQFSTPPPNASPTPSTSPIPSSPPTETSEDNTYTIYTSSSDQVDQFVMTTDQKAILFTIDACHDVQLYLTHVPGVLDVETYKIAIGEDSNTKSRIYKSLPNEYVHAVDSNVLTCSSKSFWTTWSDGKISVGEGNDVTQGAFLTWTDSAPYHVHALAFGSKDSKVVTWSFLREAGRVLNASTVTQYSMSQVWFSTIDVDWAVVRVRTCHDAHLLLSETQGSGSNTYEVAFGINNNTESVIREGAQGTNVVWIDTPGILSCTELRYFWFRWKDQRLEVGTGSTVGKSLLMEHAKPGHPETIRSIGLSTGWGADGRWEISNVQGEAYAVYSYPPTTSVLPIWFYVLGKTFTFQLQECSGAEIILAKTPLQETTPGYSVVLSSSVSSITSLPDITLTSVQTPGLLHCYSLRSFWITWSDNIRVGKGRVNYNQIMEAPVTSPPAVSAVALQTLETSTSESLWQVVKSSVGNAVFLTPSSGSDHYRSVWQTTPEQRSLVFKVRACADARVLLATYFGIIDYQVYEVWLGKNNNTMSMIMDGINGIIMDETSSRDILHCTTPRWFWIDWSNGVAVGMGSHVGDQMILNISPGTLPRPLIIDSVSLQTGPNQAGEWEFSSLPSRYFTVQTLGTAVHNHTWLVVHSVFVYFKLRACEEAKVLLAENPYDLKVYAREVIIGGWSNTRSAILRYGANSSTLVEKNTTGILQCQMLQDFWIAWNRMDGRLRVGKGELGKGEFLTYVDSDLRHIYGVSVTTGNRYHGEWQFQTSVARVFQFNTTTNYAYDQYYLHISNQNSSTFTVQACNDAHVGLFDYFLAEKAYEIVIGGSQNTKSFIRRTRLQDNQVVVDTPNILNCQQSLPFWVSWRAGHIKVGRGSIVDEQIFMEWMDPDPLTVTFFSTSTGWTSNGLWQYNNIKESSVTVLTPNNAASASNWLNFKTSQTSVSFGLHACHSAHVLLTPKDFTAPNYEVIIGSDANSKSKIVRYAMNSTSGASEGSVVSEQQTPGILSCSEPRSFWMSWRDGKIEVAKHSSSGQRFLDWMDSAPQQVHTLALTTGPDSRGEWTYSYREVSSFVYDTLEENDQYGFFALSLVGRTEATFAVRACKDAHVMFCQIPNIYAYRAYEVIVGATENTETILKRTENGMLLGLAVTPGILNCQERRVFWATWTLGSFSFGIGNIPEQNRILHHRESPGFSLGELTVRTPAGIRGTWDFSGVSGDVYELHTPDDGTNLVYSYNSITTWTETIQFVVLACNDAHVALQTIPGSSEDKMFEIVIGGWINTRSEIRNGKSGSMLAAHDELGILNCFEYRPLWIRWYAGLIEVGKGYPGSHRFMHYQLSGADNVSIASVSFTTGWGSQGDWMVYESDVSSLRVTTKPERNYNQMSKSIMTQTSIVFRVQSCRDAHVSLSQYFNNLHSGTYEIVIGGNGNMNSFIRDYATMVEKMRVSTPNIMDCNNYRAFWVRWRVDGRISVGRGAVVGSDAFLDWTDDLQRNFKGLTISTYDGATGLWDFSFLQGDTYSVFTESDYRYNYTWLWPASNFLTFKAKSCNDGHLLLSTSVLETGSSSSYEIVIGSYDNTKSEIRKGSHGAALASVDTPSVMNCKEFLPFWVRWVNKTLEVGSGPLDSHVIMRADDPDMPNIQVASVTSWTTAKAEYQFMQSEATLIRVNSSTGQSFWTLHQSTIAAHEIQFKVKASTDAVVALLSVPSNLNAPSYEVTIGGKGNTMSAITSKSPIGDLVVPEDTPGILDPASFRPFWITWYNGTVIFGSGDVIGQNRLIMFIEPQPSHKKHIHSVAVASAAGSHGEWEFVGKGVPGSPTSPATGPTSVPTSTAASSVPPSVTPPTSDDSITIYTNASNAHDHVVITTQHSLKYFVVNLDACKDAHIYLTYVPGVFDTSAYLISIGKEGNTKSSIHKKLPNESIQEFDTPNILPCTSSQPMWVKWDQGDIMVGSGSTVGQNTKFQWKDDQPYTINAFSLVSRDDKPVNWTILRDYGRSFNLSTVKDYSYQQVWMTTYYVDSVVVNIRSCRDAHVLLSEQQGMGGNTYEVAFGIINNTQSVIREGPYGPNVVIVDTPGIMSCSEYRYFWFRWKDLRLEVGSGSVVGANKFMEHAKTGHPERILSVGLSTGWEETGRWEVTNVEGAVYAMHSDEVSDENQRRIWFYPSGQYFEFYLRTCENARIRLAEVPKRDSTNGFEVTLSNGVSSIAQLNQQSIVVSKDTAFLLDCAVLRKFWVSWSQGVKVGRGKFNSDDVLLDLQGTVPVTITSVAVTTPAPSAGGGEWQVKKDTVKTTTFYTPALHKYSYAWQTTVEATAVAFKVRSCGDAYLLLVRYMGIVDFSAYEIRIGSQSNTRVEIRYGVGGTILAERQVSSPLHCTQSRWFWVDWSDGISVGSGAYLSDSALVSVSADQMLEQFQVQAAGFATGGSHDGDWEFTKVPAEYITIHTPSHHTQSTAWLMLQRRFVTFRVRACAEARVLLASDPYVVTANVKEVVIGGWGNTKSAIYGDLTGNQTVAESDTTNILNCNEGADFWIEWSSGHIAVGKGELHTQEFLRYETSGLHEIRSLSLSTGAGSTGEWELSTDIALIYQLHTTTTYDYGQHWYRVGEKTSVQFKVKACNDAHVTLFDDYMADVAYEIVLGGSGNTICAIRRTRLQENKAQVSTPQILNCGQMVPFWVSWSFGVIKVGRGNLVDVDIFMQWEDPDPLAASVVSISTGWSATGVWEFSSMEGGALKVHMTPTHQAGHYVQLEFSQQYFTFSVRACQDAQVFILPTARGPPVYQINLGIQSNTMSEILRYEGDVIEIAAQENTPGILHCSESRKFWITWENGDVQVAVGSANGRRFIGWKDDSSPQQLNTVSLASGTVAVVEWDYDYKTAQAVIHNTGGESDDAFGRVIVSVVGASEAVVGVRACHDAAVAMSEITGVYRQLTYELVIGASANAETLLRNSTGGHVLKSVATPQILSCDKLLYFWTTWSDGKISFGKGTVPGQGAVFTYPDPSWHPVNSLSFQTPAGVAGTFLTSGFTESVYALHTPDDGQNYQYKYNIITTSKDTLTFYVMACNDAHVLLQSVPGSVEDRCFEIVIGGWNNTRSVIRDKVQGIELAVSTQPLHLHCESYRGFWISWRNNTLEVGRDSPYSRSFLYYQMPEPDKTPINAVSFTTGWGSQGDWTLYETDVTSVRASTVSDLNYNQLSKLVTNQDRVVFRVQACRDAHLALSEWFNNVHTKTYEIIFGGNGNMNTFIRDRATGAEKQRVDTPNLMDCNNYKAFWAKWEPTGRITAGKGAVVGSQTLIDWIDSEKRIFQGITISTWSGASGYWDFTYVQGDIFTIFTENDYRYNYTWMYPLNKYLTFKVKSCNDGHILLSNSIGETGSSSYEIVIGGFDNTWSEIRRGSQGPALVSVETPSIMYCEELLPFWVRWENKSVVVGSGPLDSHVIMRYDDPDMPDIKVVSTTSWTTAASEYQFMQTEVSSIKANTTSRQGFWTLHHSTTNSQEIKFKVKSSHDAMLAMLSVTNNIKAPHYELTIGAHGNTISQLKVKSVNGEIPFQVDTPQILDGSSFLPFWITWTNGTVQFGKGDVVGQNRLLTYVDSLPAYRKDVHAVAVASGADAFAEWEFQGQATDNSTSTTIPSEGSSTQPTQQPSSSPHPPSNPDDLYSFKTDSTKAPDHVVVTSQRGHLVFYINACKEAHIYLTHVPGVTDDKAYKISIGTSSNTKSSISKTLPSEYTQEFDTPNILSCSEGQPFWARWEMGAIMVGAGLYVGQDLKFHWNDTQPYTINAFSLASHDDKTVMWSFQRDYGRIFNVSTIKDYSYDQVWLSTYYVDHVILSIMACRDAHILLSELAGMGNNTYEVAFGILDNTKSVIREGPYGANVVSADTPGIMNCTEYRYFWIRWKDKRLEVGTGSVVGVNEIMEHAKTNHPERIVSVGLSTGWEATGRWQVSNLEGISYSVFTNEVSNVSDRRTWFYPVGQYVEFQLRTCENALIRLAEVPKKETTNGYDIALSNVQSSIKKLNDPNLQVAADTPYLLHCTSLRKYWITWSQGAVKVGRGKLNTEHLLWLNDSSPAAISAFSVITPAPSSGGGEWQILKETVKSTVFYTPASYQYRNVWYTAVESKVVTFKVRACADVYVALTKYFGITNYGVYEVLIGGQSNSKVEIRYGVGGTMLAEKSLSNLLHCTQSKWFWIDWSNGIYVGAGAYVSDAALLSVSLGQMPEQFPIYAAAFSTGSSSDGDWEFSDSPAEQFSIATPSHIEHGRTWLIMQRNYLLFRVRACSEARLLLAYDPFDLTSNTKEVIIGGWSNTKSEIYGDMSSNQTLATQETAAILHCDAFNDFWVQWSGSGVTVASGIAVGRGSVLNSQEFLRCNLANLHNIHAVSISTGAGSTGEWQISLQSAVIYQLHTTTLYSYSSYSYRVGTKTNLQFKVKACNDAHVALFDEYMLDQAYEIVIGGSGNTLSSIRRTRLQDNKVSVTTQQILNCDQILPFWLSWSYGTIKVGKGNIVNEELFMEWQDPEPLAVSIASVSTGWGSIGVWEFSSTDARVIKVQTNPEHTYGHWLELKSSQKSYEFSVRSCQHARIFLSHVPYGAASYEIILGAANNTQSEIHRYDGSVMHRVALEMTPAVVDCSVSRRFWVSWANGEIEVAYGSASGRRFLGWKDDNPHPVYALSFSNGQGDWAEWDYSYVAALGFVHETGMPIDSYGRIMLSVTDYKEFIFALKACSGASIAFSQVAGIYTHYTYELVIGATGNTETILRSSVGGAVLKSVYTHQILDCNAVRIFWVSWRDGVIAFGKGITVKQGEVFRVSVSNMIAINSLSLLTPADVKGVWGISTTMGNFWEIHTPDDGSNYKYTYNTFTTHGHTISFEVNACNDAHVLLQSVPGSSDDACHEIVIGGWTNTKSVIRNGYQGTDVAEHSESFLLDCNQYRAFWISWQNGTIKVGKNNPNTQIFLSYQMPNPDSTPVTAVSFTSGFGSEADWLLLESDVTSMRVTTTPSHNYNQLSKSIFGQDSVVFRVQACRDAHLTLSKLFNNIESDTYEMVIGGNNNLQSFIRDRATMTDVQRVDTPNIMDCNNYKAFWAKWEKATYRITVGNGAVIGKYAFLDWVDTNQRSFQGFTITTYNGASGLWDFSFLQGNVYSIFTEAEYKYEYGWFQQSSNYVTFRVRTCDNAHLLLSSKMNEVTTGAYEIVLGGYENTKSDIRRGAHGDILQQVETPGIVNCNEYLPFWAKWENKTLQIGSGNLDEQVVMRVDDPEMPAISAVSVSSWSSARAEFQFPETQVTLLKAYTVAKQGYRTVHRSLIDQSQLVFKVRAQKDAKVALLIVHGNVLTASYEVEMGVEANTKCLLKVKMSVGDMVSEASTPNVLYEMELRSFWISWHNGTIRFGSGESVDQNQLLSVTDPQPAYRRHIHSAAVATGDGPNGEWEFRGTLDDGNGGTTTTGGSTVATVPPSSGSDASSSTPIFLSTLAQSSGGSSGPDPGMVAGIVLGCIAGILVIVLIVMYVVKRYRKKKLEESEQINFDNPAYYGNVVELTPTSSKSDA